MPKNKNHRTPSPTPNQGRQGLVGHLRTKRKNRLEQKRAARREAAHTFVLRNKIQGVPLALDGAMLGTGVAAAIDPTAGVITGTASTVITGAGAGFQLESKHELGLVGGQLAAGMGWATGAGVAGLDNPYILIAAVVVGGVAQLSWVDQRKTRKEPVAKRSISDLWNTDETGVLAKAGAEGARMCRHATVYNRDGSPIGDDYEVDISGANLLQDAFCGKAGAIAGEMPGKVRRGAVNIYADSDDVNHCTVRAIWLAPWKNDNAATIVNHTLVQHLTELHEIVNNAIDRRSNPELPTKTIPAHLKPWLPRMRSYVDPIPVGEREDQSTFYERNYKKGFGVLHKFVIAESGGGKTSYANSEIASTLPCRDVLPWIIDLSAKQGSHYAGWGSCIDWIATTPDEARSMLHTAMNIATQRGHTYHGTGPARSPKQCPTIKLIIDELAALYEALDTEAYELLDPLVRQGRTQGVQIVLFDQTGMQIGGMYGLKNLLRNVHKRAALKVSDAGSLKGALRNPDVPYDMTSAPQGVIAIEDYQADRAEVFRSYFVDEGDEEDPDDHGMLAPIAAIYAPFRPVLDEESYAAAGKAYHNRALVRTENPLLTPDEIVMSHAPVNPVQTEDDLAENVNNIKTGSNWLDAIMNGDLTVHTPNITGPDGETDLGEENDGTGLVDTANPPKGLNAIAKDQGIPTSSSPHGRQERRTLTRERHDDRASNLDAALADINEKQASIPKGMSVSEAIGPQPEPQSFPDSDRIMATAIETLRTQASKGLSTAELAHQVGAKKRDTVVARLRYLEHTSRAVHVGKGPGARWYHPDSAPAQG